MANEMGTQTVGEWIADGLMVEEELADVADDGSGEAARLLLEAIEAHDDGLAGVLAVLHRAASGAADIGGDARVRRLASHLELVSSYARAVRS